MTPTQTIEHPPAVAGYSIRLAMVRQALFELLGDTASLELPTRVQLVDAIQRAANEVGCAERLVRGD